MILRAIRVQSVAVLNPGIELSGLGPGITVLHGRNEAGKSTLLRALIYALYQRHKVGGVDVEADLLPEGTSLGPSVEVELERGGVLWKIEKTFLKSKRSRLSRWEETRFVPIRDGDEADEELARVLDGVFAGKGRSKPEHRGIGEVLISDQGQLCQVHALGERAKASLRDVLGAVASTREAKGLAAIVKERHERFFTSKSEPRETTELCRVETRVAELEEALTAARAEAAVIRELELALQEGTPDPSGLAAQRTGLEADRETAREENERRIRLQSTVEGAARDRALAQQAVREAEVVHERLAVLDRELQTMERSLVQASALRQRVEDERERARVAVRRIEEARDELDVRSRDLAAERTSAADARRAAELQSSLDELLPRLETYRLAVEEAQRHSTELAARARPDQEDFTALGKLRRQIAERVAQLEAMSLRLRLQARSPLVLRTGTVEVSLEAGQVHEAVGQSPLTAEIAGIAKLEVLGPRSEEAAKLRSDLGELEDAWSRRTDPYGTQDELELERLFAERAALQQRRDAARNRAQGWFASQEEYDKALASSSSMRRELDAILGRHAEWGGERPPKATADERVAVVERMAARHAEQAEALLLELVRAREHQAEVERNEKLVVQECVLLSTQRIEARAEWAAKGGETPAAEREAVVTALRRSFSERQETLASIERELAPLEHAEAALQRAERALREFDAGVHDRERKRSEDEGRLTEMRSRGLYGRLAELAEEHGELLAKLESLRNEARALQLLYDSFQEEERRAIEAVFAPVAEKVGRMALAVLRKSLRMDFDEKLGTPRVELGGHAFTLDQLSGGTRDQIALFTRIAFAELYAERHGRHALVLDDPLVNSDPERRARILDVLARAARDLQILVFTCRPDDYLGLSCEKREIGT